MFDIQDLVHLEQDFFDAGYKDGYAHGRLHGLIEGRALGREKGFEIWEEIGFYEGFALTWRNMYENTLSKEDDGEKMQTVSLSPISVSHIRHLLQLISQFPKVNPTSVLIRGGSDMPTDSSNLHRTPQPDSELDVSALLNNIRSRYKALCASLGVRARVVGSSVANTDVKVEEDASDHPVPSRIGKKPKRTVWKINIGDEIGNDTHTSSDDIAVPGIGGLMRLRTN
ncbi:hypothetical protein Clacol_007690 [Clathrus columnatus]|uniref:Essential protein Yae1 N-terminal domain-containing protein n=1 Tax=Clathrus columnatus TaxID=1419009 RepID=A0AAV5AKG0_9AGAM|nr:hypothetical protein Clacol_007690 [Clathrus columnatus]